MIWDFDETTESYQLDHPHGHARVWPDPIGSWQVFVQGALRSSFGILYPSVEAAQQWAETTLAALAIDERQADLGRD